MDLNGKNSILKTYYETQGYKYICADVIQDPLNDITIKIGDKLPFDNQSIDFIVFNYNNDRLF